MSESEDNNSNDLPLITFNSLYNILRQEKKSQNLISLPDKFYDAIHIFLTNKRNEIKKIDSQSEALKFRKEKNVLKNSIKIITEILVLRTTKIAKISLHNTLYEDKIFDENNILKKEQELFKVIKESSKNLKTKTFEKNG